MGQESESESVSGNVNEPLPGESALPKRSVRSEYRSMQFTEWRFQPLRHVYLDDV